jgi:hypothetical protein
MVISIEEKRGDMVRRSNLMRKGHNANALAPIVKRSGHRTWFERLTMTAFFLSFLYRNFAKFQALAF